MKLYFVFFPLLTNCLLMPAFVARILQNLTWRRKKEIQWAACPMAGETCCFLNHMTLSNMLSIILKHCCIIDSGTVLWFIRLIFKLPRLLILILQPFIRKVYQWHSDSWISFHLNKLSDTKFSLLYYISLVRSWKEKFTLISPGT